MNGRIDVAVLGRAREVEIVAASAAVALAVGAGPRAAVVLDTRDGRVRRLAPPTPHAARLRDRLVSRELGAVASGRAVWCAASSERDVSLAAACAPAVLAVCGPREPWIEPLLDEAGLVLVTGDEHDPVVGLALEELRERAIPASSLPAPEGVAAMLRRSGLWSDRSLRTRIERESVPA